MLQAKALSTIVLLLTLGLNFLQQQTSDPTQQNDARDVKRQKKADEDEQLKERMALQSLIIYAQSCAPEFAADTTLRLAESEKIKDEKWKRQLLEEAFRIASEAKHPYKRTYLPGSQVDTRSGYLASALHLNLDRLSLQCRSVKALLGVDKERARELFKEISPFKLPPLTCEDSLVYDISVYYQTASAIAQTAFNEKEVRRAEPIYFAQSCVENISSPAQIAPAIDLILSLKTSASQLETLTYTFSTALRKISGDDRSFSVPSLSLAVIGAIEQLSKSCIERKISTDELLTSFRKYLINHFSATRCADTLNNQQQKSVETNLITYFNTYLRTATYSNQKEIFPLSGDEIKPAKIDGSTRYHLYWTSPKSKNLLLRVQNLNFRSQEKQFTEEEKQGAEWQWRLAQFLTDMATWNAEDEKSEEDYVHQKSVQFYKVIEITPTSRLRDNVVHDLVIFLSNAKLQKSNPVEWFLHVNDVLRIARSSSSDDREKIIEALKQSGSPALYVYAELEKLFPPPSTDDKK
jgi:hypothetical protein